jgi:hypothetical protein
VNTVVNLQVLKTSGFFFDKLSDSELVIVNLFHEINLITGARVLH